MWLIVPILISLVASMVLSELTRPRPKDARKPDGLGDFKFPTATEGRFVPLLWGTRKLSGPNVIWYGDFQQEPIRRSQRTGLILSSSVTVGYKYKIGMQMALCRGSEDDGEVSVIRIWVADKVLWTGSLVGDGAEDDIDLPDFFGGDTLGQGGIVGKIRLHPGTRTQAVDSYLEPFQLINGDAPAYRRTAYVVFGEPGYIGTNTQIDPWAFEASRIPNGLALADPTVNTFDANPMNVFYDIVTNDEWGMAQDPSTIDLTNLAEAAETLRTEGNGISLLVDHVITIEDLVRIIEAQIDGTFYQDRFTGKWKVVLVRGGYDVDSLPYLNERNTIEIESFTRSSWDDTINSMQVSYAARNRDYEDAFAPAQDIANVRTRNNAIVTSTKNYPGVVDGDLANSIAWRDLRLLSCPLARAVVVCDRTLYGLNIGDVIRWSDLSLGINRVPMRVSKIDWGQLADGKIRLYLLQDVFLHDTGAFVAPPAPHWSGNADDVDPLDVTDQVVMEAPRAFITHDPQGTAISDRIWAGARSQQAQVSLLRIFTDPPGFDVDHRRYPSGTVVQLMAAGKLVSSIDQSGTQGSITITVQPDPDTLDYLQSKLVLDATDDDIGQRLGNLVFVDDEFFAFKTWVVSGGNLVLSGGYRGMLDSAPSEHPSTTAVYIMVGNITDRAFTAGTSVDVKIAPNSYFQSGDLSAAHTWTISMDNRIRRPYPPVNFTAEGVAYPTSAVDLDTSHGGNLDDYGIDIGFTRRDFRLYDERVGVVDESSLPTDFPTANTTQYQMDVRNDPAGANTLLYTTAWASPGTIRINRDRLLRFTAGVQPSRLRTVIHTRHTYSGVVYGANQDLQWDFNTTDSLLGGDTNMGVIANGVSSSAHTAASTGTYTLTIGTALATGAVQVSINGGAFAPVVLATTTSGTFAATAGDSIVIKHTQATSTDSETFCELSFAASGVGYAILTY